METVRLRKGSGYKEIAETSKSSSESPIINCILYILVFAIWISLLYVILEYSGVLPYLSSFNSEFRYVRGKTPLTSRGCIIGLIGGYVISLPILQCYMSHRKPLQQHRFMVIHNAFLMISSALLSMGIGYIIIKDIYKNGIYHSICSSGNSCLLFMNRES